MQRPFRSGFVCLLFAVQACLVSGCANYQELLLQRQEEGHEGFGRVPHGAGPYGAAHDVLETVATAKRAGRVHLISSRAIRLPTHELGTITVFDYRLPAACGGYMFRLYETGKTQILEYDYQRGDGASYVIRDYVAGANPFIKPGLWTSFDHTADSVAEMMARFVETGSRLVPAVYSQGLVTSLPSLAYAGIPYQVFGQRSGAFSVTSSWMRLAIL